MAYAPLGPLRRVALADAALARSALVKIIARRVRIAFASGDAAIRAGRPRVLRAGIGLRRRPSGSGVLTRAGSLRDVSPPAPDRAQ
jgi:hypothetical protein